MRQVGGMSISLYIFRTTTLSCCILEILPACVYWAYIQYLLRRMLYFLPLSFDIRISVMVSIYNISRKMYAPIYRNFIFRTNSLYPNVTKNYNYPHIIKFELYIKSICNRFYKNNVVGLFSINLKLRKKINLLN